MPLTDTRDLQRLAGLRRRLGYAKQALTFNQQRMLDTPEGQAMQENKQLVLDVQTAIAETEAAIRGLALEHYDETGHRVPWPGVTIKLFKVVNYAPMRALDWARREARHLLVLDKRAFEKAVKAGLPDMPAELTTEPRATIARDLSEYLPGDK